MAEEVLNPREIILRDTLKRIEESGTDTLRPEEHAFHRKAEEILKNILKEHRDIRLSPHEQEEVLTDIIHYFIGLGPIDSLIKDPEVSEVMINGPKEVYIEKRGNLELTEVTFKDAEQLMYFVEKMLTHFGRRLTELEPYVDTMLKDGSRVNIVKHPVSLTGPIVTIRKFAHHVFNVDELIRLGTLNEAGAGFLKAVVASRLNILISGGASSGKTTLLNTLASFIPQRERVVVIEDTPELKIPDKHIVFLGTRPANIEGKGAITTRDLVRNALHMRPDRIVVGEIRSDEVLDMIQAMNTGHDGSMTTLHANSALDALDRLEILALLGRSNISSEVARRMIINAIDLVIQMARLADGSRKIVSISEVIKDKSGLIEEIFALDRKTGGLKSTGRVPAFYPRLKEKTNYTHSEFEKA